MKNNVDFLKIEFNDGIEVEWDKHETGELIFGSGGIHIVEVRSEDNNKRYHVIEFYPYNNIKSILYHEHQHKTSK